MPNICFFSMKVKGTQSSCYEWLKRMESYDEPNHFFRIFEHDVIEENGNNENFYMIIKGECAWSLESCCRASGYSNGTDLFEVNSRELNVIMEVYSEECGMGFQEHYIYNNGELKCDECVDYEEYWWDDNEFPSFNDFKQEYGLPESLREEDLEDQYYYVGGFSDWNFVI